jgi:hypothetical protein
VDNPAPPPCLPETARVSSPEPPIGNPVELQALWQRLMGRGRFGKRTLWLLFLDESDRPIKLIVPIEGIPVEPDVAALDGIGRMLDAVHDERRSGTVPMLLSRPGAGAMTGSDRRWAAEITRRLSRNLGPWPIHLATCNRIRVFAPDDLVPAS